MSVLDKLGKKAMDAVDSATRVAGKVQAKVDPLIDKSPLASRLRDRLFPEDEDVFIPDTNIATAAHPDFGGTSPDAPPDLGKPELAAQVYGNGTDPWAGRAKRLLEDRAIEHEFVDLEDEDGAKFAPHLLRATKQNAGPYIYVRGDFIGGFNALSEIDRLGQLDEMIKTPEERSQAPGIRVVIAKRDDGDQFPGGHGNPDDRT